MDDLPDHRRLSKLSLLPLLLSVGAWISLAAALISIIGFAEIDPQSLVGGSGAAMAALLVFSLVALLLFSIGSLGAGGASFLRVQLDLSEVRGRGFAAAGCLSTLTSMLLSVLIIFPIVLGALLFAGFIVVLFLSFAWNNH